MPTSTFPLLLNQLQSHRQNSVVSPFGYHFRISTSNFKFVSYSLISPLPTCRTLPRWNHLCCGKSKTTIKARLRWPRCPPRHIKNFRPPAYSVTMKSSVVFFLRPWQFPFTMHLAPQRRHLLKSTIIHDFENVNLVCPQCISVFLARYVFISTHGFMRSTR